MESVLRRAVSIPEGGLAMPSSRLGSRLTWKSSGLIRTRVISRQTSITDQNRPACFCLVHPEIRLSVLSPQRNRAKEQQQPPFAGAHSGCLNDRFRTQPAFLMTSLLRRRNHPPWLRYALSASSTDCTSATAGARHEWSRSQALPGRRLRRLATTSHEKCGLKAVIQVAREESEVFQDRS